MRASIAEDAEPCFSSHLSPVTVVVVTRESAHCLEALVPLLSRCAEVIISDNASSDGTPELARRLWPHAHVLTHSKNLGFGAANNRALVRVQTPMAFLLNPDCGISVQGLCRLLEVAQAFPQAAVVAPQLINAQGRPELNYRWPKTHWAPLGPGASGPACVGFLCGAAMLLRMSQLKATGYFDESFFLYYEDDDLCLRLFQDHQNLLLVPDVLATHHSRGSVQGTHPWRNEFGRGFHHAQSKLIFARKHQSLPEAIRQRRWLLLTTTLSLPVRTVFFSPKLLARMLGRWWGVWTWLPAR